MQNILKQLKTDIDYAVSNNSEMNEKSWGMQEGVLLSVNDAKIIFEKLTELGCCNHSATEYIPGAFGYTVCKTCGLKW